jgi:hypothetical protein
LNRLYDSLLIRLGPASAAAAISSCSSPSGVSLRFRRFEGDLDGPAVGLGLAAKPNPIELCAFRLNGSICIESTKDAIRLG